LKTGFHWERSLSIPECSSKLFVIKELRYYQGYSGNHLDCLKQEQSQKGKDCCVRTYELAQIQQDT